MKLRLQVLFTVFFIAASVFAKDISEVKAMYCHCSRNVTQKENKDYFSTQCTKCTNKELPHFEKAVALIQRCPSDSTSFDCDEYLQLECFLSGHPELVHRYNNRRETLMFIAARANKCNVMKLLFSCGAPLDTQDLDGDTPLLSAIQRNNVEAAIILLSFGADSKVKNGKGYDAYQLACTLPDRTILCVVNYYNRLHST